MDFTSQTRMYKDILIQKAQHKSYNDATIDMIVFAYVEHIRNGLTEYEAMVKTTDEEI